MTQDDLEKFIKAVYNHAQPDKGYDGAGELTVPEALLEIRQFITEYAAKKVLEARLDELSLFNDVPPNISTAIGYVNTRTRDLQAELSKLKEEE